jgi:lipid-A-disaccharide synthase
MYTEKIKDLNLEIKVVEGKNYDCLGASDFVLVCSGTATLETAIMGVPFFIIYKMNLLNYLLYRPQIKIPYIGMVNIIAKRKIIPEFIQFKAKPKIIAKELIKTLKDSSKIQEIKDKLIQIKNLLGPEGANRRAAKIILGLLNS